MSGTDCPLCLRRVLDSECGIQCDSQCKRWFHVSCIGMLKAEYQKYCNDANLPWNCLRSDCLPQDQLPMNIFMSKLLASVNEIKESVNDLRDVPSKIDRLQTELSSISNKLSSLEARVSSAEGHLNDLGVRVAAVEGKATTSNSSPEETIAEFNDRSRRANNLMVYNFPENSSRTAEARMENDSAGFLKLLTYFAPDLPSDFKCHRVGRPQKDKARPLKVIFSSPEHPKLLLNNLVKDDLSKVCPSFSEVALSRDRTDRERQYLKQLRQELESRIKEGEDNLTIKYINGVPSIVKSLQKN